VVKDKLDYKKYSDPRNGGLKFGRRGYASKELPYRLSKVSIPKQTSPSRIWLEKLRKWKTLPGFQRYFLLELQLEYLKFTMFCLSYNYFIPWIQWEEPYDEKKRRDYPSVCLNLLEKHIRELFVRVSFRFIGLRWNCRELLFLTNSGAYKRVKRRQDSIPFFFLWWKNIIKHATQMLLFPIIYRTENCRSCTWRVHPLSNFFKNDQLILEDSENPLYSNCLFYFFKVLGQGFMIISSLGRIYMLFSHTKQIYEL